MEIGGLRRADAGAVTLRPEILRFAQDDKSTLVLLAVVILMTEWNEARYFLAGFSFLYSFVEESFDEESLLEESLESLESFLSEEDFSSLADSLAGDFPA